MDDLESCPFCGEATKIEVLDVAVDIQPTFAVTCDECQASGPIDDTRDQAIANWNRRPASTLAYETRSGGQLPITGHNVDARGWFGTEKPGDRPLDDLVPPTSHATKGQMAVGPDRSPVPLRVHDDISAARERRELAGLPSISTTAEPDGLSMDFDLGGDKPRKR